MSRVDDETRARIDEALRSWKQGDCVLERQWFLSRSDPAAPLTKESAAIAREGHDLVESEVAGLAVVTQTCDIVRSCRDRPYLEASPLVEVGPENLRAIEKGWYPGYAYLPGTAKRKLVVDLDRVMTIEKSVAAVWERVEGCRNRDEKRRLSQMLARKRERVAFPDDFTSVVAPLRKRMVNKHEKNSEEGEALRALRQIRVIASPSWSAEEVSLSFLFLRCEDEPDFNGRSWWVHLKSWNKLLVPTGRFSSIDGQVVALEDITALDYVESDPLDLDHLSAPAGNGS